MRRAMILITVVLVLSTSTVFAADELLISLIGLGLDTASTIKRGQVEVLFPEGDGVTIGGTGIRKLKNTFEEHDFLTLPYEERLELSERLSVSITWPVFKNLLFGFGSGSALQHDTLGSISGIIIDSATVGIFSIGLSVLLIDAMFLAPLRSLSGTPASQDELLLLGVNLMKYGAIAFAGGRVIQAALPLFYGPRYNKVVRNNLGINKDKSDAFGMNLGFAPILGEGGALHWQVAARIPLQ